MKKKGKLIVFEGVSGTGKETQAKILKNYLGTKGIKSTIVYHPSPELKEILGVWRKSRKINNISEVYFLLADRYNRIESVIKPALAKGEWVISLRSYLSALVYQGQTAMERKWISAEFKRFEPEPDFLFWFDIKPDDALKRINERHRKTGEPLGKFETLNYLSQKRKAYQEVMKNLKHTHLDAGLTIAEINKIIITACTATAD